ncbi:MAG: MFS transporter [Planctomycetaceae bacterium]|jgi:MFS family permease|nr:MFS transporter [Planctomycetaceae bacterium]
MTRTVFRLILLVSCAHALVHVFELALPSVEQMIGDDLKASKATTGALGMAWRLPFGLLAMAAGWLADRYGSRKMLIVYLLGCMTTAIIAAMSRDLGTLFVAMFAMGCFASIYHPAGLSLISRVTTPETRGRALGWHGIFGSIGITAAPLGAGLLFGTGWLGWRGYYGLLVLPAAVIAVMLLFSIRRLGSTRDNLSDTIRSENEDGRFRVGPYALLVGSGAMSGFVYGSFLHFLQRYLDGANLRPPSIPAESFRNYLAALTLLFAVVGQAIAGRLARPRRLEWLQVAILAASIPCLVWMAFAEGWGRPAATCAFALIHFMTQPVYNSLIAQLVPARRRSTGYGFSNMICFGLGGLGPFIVGQSADNRLIYGGLAGVVTLATLLAAGLWWMTRVRTMHDLQPPSPDENA